MRVVFTLLPCLGELGMINNIPDCILLLQLLFMVTLMHLEDTCTDMTWHRKAGGGDTNSMAWQAKSSWAITAKAGVILSLKAKYCYSELSCLTLNVHSQKIIWKNWANSDHFVIPVPSVSPLMQRSVVSKTEKQHKFPFQRCPGVIMKDEKIFKGV